MRHKCSSHCKHLLLTAAECSSKLSLSLLKSGESSVNFLERLFHLGLIFSGIGSHLKVLQNRHLCKNSSSFGHLCHSESHYLVAGCLCKLFSLVGYGPASGLDKSRKCVKSSCLTRTVGTDKSYDLALVYMKRYSLKRLDNAIIYT